MSKLYIKQQVLSAVDKFTVKDEFQEDRFIVQGDFLTVGGKKLHIKDMSGRELAMVQQKFLSLMPKFFVLINGVQAAEIKKKLALFGSKYIVEGPGWTVKGSILQHDYTFLSGSKEVMRLHKVWLSWGDSYELEIDDDADTLMALACVLAIDCVLEAEAQSHSESDHD